MKIIVLGPQGSGKSTQAKLLADFLGVPCLSVGDLLYFASQEESEQSREIKRIMDSGQLVDDNLTLKVLKEQLESDNYQKGVIIDGFPRRLSQAKAFNVQIDKVIYIKVSDEVGKERLLKRQRKDDTPEGIRQRLQLYHQETVPVLDFYKENGILIEVNGEQSIEKIHEDILKLLGLNQ